MCRKGSLQYVCAATFFLFFRISSQKSQSFLSCLRLINETWRIDWGTVSLCPCSAQLSVLLTQSFGHSHCSQDPGGKQSDGLGEEHIGTAVGWRQAVFYFGVSSLLGWPRRWKIRFSILTFPEWVIFQGAMQEMKMIHKGKSVLTGHRSMEARWRQIVLCSPVSPIWLSPST